MIILLAQLECDSCENVSEGQFKLELELIRPIYGKDDRSNINLFDMELPDGWEWGEKNSLICKKCIEQAKQEKDEW